MALLDRVTECNQGRHPRVRARTLPLRVEGEALGRFLRSRVPLLRSIGLPHRVDEAEGDLHLELPQSSLEARSERLQKAVEALVALGVLPSLRDERFDVPPAPLGPVRMRVDRAAVPWFGFTALGVHLTAWTRGPDGALRVWIARRDRRRGAYAGLLDNTVAGGQPSGLTPFENLLKECGEEAGLAPERASEARLIGAIGYEHCEPAGIRPDVMLCYELELPLHEHPMPCDGEVESFWTWSLPRLAEELANTRNFKFNSALVALDFLLRHGALPPHGEQWWPMLRALRGPSSSLPSGRSLIL